jgi:predicted DNA binding CopG/RHH family protein
MFFYAIMAIFKWNAEKNEILTWERGITFEEIVQIIESGAKAIEDEYEKEILEAYENGSLKPSKTQVDFQTIASNTLKKNRKINISISENDLSALQRRAAREGIPYQTLIGSVLHEYASGFLIEAR